MEIQNIDVIRSRYKVVPRTLVFIKNKDKYLLINKNKQDSFGFKKLNGVGGHIEKGEEPFESAHREVAEETGVEIENLELAVILFIDISEIPGIEVFVFRADYVRGKISQSEEGTLEWMSYCEIVKSKDVLTDVPELIQICETHKKGCKPAILKYSYTDSGELRIVIR